MVKAGYDRLLPLQWEIKSLENLFGIGDLHIYTRKVLKELIDMYKYIYVKYPQYLNSPLTKSPSFKNFEYSMAKEIREFQQKQKRRQMKQQENI
ncbi:MAG: hypothetical protein ACLSA2_06860 [Candidatus Gastranaerophilaceae bacterium]